MTIKSWSGKWLKVVCYGTMRKREKKVVMTRNRFFKTQCSDFLASNLGLKFFVHLMSNIDT